MEQQKLFTGETENEVWDQVAADLGEGEQFVYDYNAILAQGDKRTELIIEIDPGGGFEGGYENTAFCAELADAQNFRFAVHVDHFIDDIGKFLGMQDVEVGYPELDHHLIIKTNDETKIKALFTDSETRAVFEKLDNFDFGIRMHTVEGHAHKEAFLELNIDEGITDAAELRKLYHAFYSVLVIIDGFNDPISSN
jgi:hypothetical protein